MSGGRRETERQTGSTGERQEEEERQEARELVVPGRHLMGALVA